MRPIDADALINTMCFRCKDGDGEGACAEVCRFANAVSKIPTLDYAPVIRCKDCMWWKTNGCWFHQPGKCVEREPNDFCSDGQRRRTDVRITD